MRILIFLTIIFFLGCKTSTNQSNTNTVDKTHELKKNQYLATVVQAANTSRQESIKVNNDLYLKIDGEIYFVKFSEGYVSYDKLKNHLNQEIVVKVEFKTGLWEVQEPSSISSTEQPKAARSGKYVALIKIYGN